MKKLQRCSISNLVKICLTCVQNLKMQLLQSSTDEEDNFEPMNSTFDSFNESFPKNSTFTKYT